MPKRISESVRKEVLARDGHRCIECEAPGIHDMHHCFQRSRYHGKDRDEAWNLVNLCRKCHDLLHVRRELREKYERLAFSRRPADRPLAAVMLPYATSRNTSVRGDSPSST